MESNFQSSCPHLYAALSKEVKVLLVNNKLRRAANLLHEMVIVSNANLEEDILNAQARLVRYERDFNEKRMALADYDICLNRVFRLLYYILKRI